MKLTDRTIQVLKNFSTINNGIIIKAGNKQSTVSITKDILATAVIDQDFPVDVPIYDLTGFLSMLSTFDENHDAEIEFEENYLRVKSGRRSLRYFYASPEVIFTPPEGIDLGIPTDLFDLPVSDLNLIQKIANYGMGELNIVSTGTSPITISVSNSENTSAPEMKIEIDENLPECDATFNIEYMKVIPDEYKLGINDISVYMENKDKSNQYWILLKD